ncbi:MAG: hypothetical protein AAFU79_01530 [Myxococcota bacterium]
MTIGAASGELTLLAEPTRSGAARAVGVEVTDPSDASTTQQARTYLLDGIDVYVVSAVGHRFHRGPALPNLVQKTTAAVGPAVAVRGAVRLVDSSTAKTGVTFRYFLPAGR